MEQGWTRVSLATDKLSQTYLVDVNVYEHISVKYRSLPIMYHCLSTSYPGVSIWQVWRIYSLWLLRNWAESNKRLSFKFYPFFVKYRAISIMHHLKHIFSSCTCGVCSFTLSQATFLRYLLLALKNCIIVFKFR